ncbi:hypothetical protein F5144DRAFT_626009 [Chaetomium tenue]|uniref:Uncharacterized protein n=1 Tax=Chaetomium tenue TaxID=1854479 RepID=A0ACB7PPA9_9PEZI|nr:hypothetical protein F5144DRAFT_626009 [Chaetomium globosum]
MSQINGQEVGATGYGLMGKPLNFSLNPRPATGHVHPSFGARTRFLRSSKPSGACAPPSCNCLTILEAYFAKYPEDADKVALSICQGPQSPEPSGARRSLDNTIKLLNGRKKLDTFACARRDSRLEDYV